MGIEVTGKLHAVFETKQVSDRFTKREIVLEIADNPKYPQLVQFQLTGDRCSQVDNVRVGDLVRVEFSLRGREWKSPQGEVKYFNSLDVWRIEPAQNQFAGGSAPGRGRGGYDRNDNFGGGGSTNSRGRSGGGGDMPSHMQESVPRVDDDIPF